MTLKTKNLPSPTELRKYMEDPVIIAHNCGYPDRDIKAQLYSPEATRICVEKGIPFLEIDVDYIDGRWRYYHAGKPVPIGFVTINGVERYIPGVSNGISLDCFLETFYNAIIKNSPTTLPGLFIDLKEMPGVSIERAKKHVDFTSEAFNSVCIHVNELFDTIAEKITRPLKKAGMEFKIPIIFYTGRLPIPGIPVDYITTHAVLKYVNDYLSTDDDSSHPLSNVSELTLVTRWCQQKELVNQYSAITMKLRDDSEFQVPNRFTNLANQISQARDIYIGRMILQPFYTNRVLRVKSLKFSWGFNPHDLPMLTYDFNAIIKNRNLVVPWVTGSLIDKDGKDRWIKLINVLHTKAKSAKKKIRWGVITYFPVEFKTFWTEIIKDQGIK